MMMLVSALVASDRVGAFALCWLLCLLAACPTGSGAVANSGLNAVHVGRFQAARNEPGAAAAGYLERRATTTTTKKTTTSTTTGKTSTPVKITTAKSTTNKTLTTSSKKTSSYTSPTSTSKKTSKPSSPTQTTVKGTTSSTKKSASSTKTTTSTKPSTTAKSTSSLKTSSPSKFSSTTANSTTSSKPNPSSTSQTSSTTTRAPTSTSKSTTEATTTTSSKISSSTSVPPAVLPTGYPATTCPYPSVYGKKLWTGNNDNATYSWIGGKDPSNTISSVSHVQVYSEKLAHGSGNLVSDSIYYDISDPQLIKASYVNGSQITVDFVNGKLTFNDCNMTYVTPLNTSPSKSTRRDLYPERRTKLGKRLSYTYAGGVVVKVHIDSKCGDPAPDAMPYIQCVDQDQGYLLDGLIPEPIRLSYAGKPGDYAAFCPFPYIVDATDTPGCKIVKPGLEALCALSNFLNPDGIIGSWCYNAAQTLIGSQKLLIQEAAVVAEWCASVNEALGLYCKAQGELTDNHLSRWENFWCHPPPAYTKMTIKGFGLNPGSQLEAESDETEYDLGSQDSNNPHDVEYFHSVSAVPGGTCGPCDASSNNRRITTPWVQVYGGAMDLRHDYSCPGWGYTGSIPAGSLGDAQTKCQAQAETYNYQGYWVDESIPIDKTTGERLNDYKSHGCWVSACQMAPEDFTFDLDAFNGWHAFDETVQAYSRTIEYSGFYGANIV